VGQVTTGRSEHFLPFSRLADRIIAHAPRLSGKEEREGSVLGGLGRLFEDR